MSLRTLALDWNLDGPVGALFLGITLYAAALYVAAARRGRLRDRRGRRWPARRTACFLSGLAVLVVDLYSGIGEQADARLSVHVVEHMVMWVVVAPLLAAGGCVRLAFFALPPVGRRRLATALRWPIVRAVTGPVGSLLLFSCVIGTGHLPAMYGLALSNDYVHEAEHALYLFSAVIMWASVLGVDPLPHRAGPRGRLACMAACMVPMAVIAAWWATAPAPVYAAYMGMPGASALHDQHVAATIMWAASGPAFAIPALARPHLRGRWRLPKVVSRELHA